VLLARIVHFVQQQRLPVKVIAKTVGCNLDELDAGLFSKVDLVISPEMPEDSILERLAMAFDMP